jgi:hypothetical protein
MSTAVSVMALGYALEFFGFVLAAFGIRRTWRDFAKGERFFEPIHQAAERVGAAGAAVATGLMSRRRDAVIRAGSATATAGVGATVTARVGPGPLTPAVDLETFASVVEQQMRDVYERLNVLREADAAEARARTDADSELAGRLGVEVAGVEGMSRSVAVGGLRQQFVGLLLASVGLILQAVATFM